MQCPHCRVAHIREDAAAKYCCTCGLIEWKKEGDDMEEIVDLITRLVLEGKREEARTALHEYGSYRVRLDEQLNRKQWTEPGTTGSGNAPAANAPHEPQPPTKTVRTP